MHVIEEMHNLTKGDCIIATDVGQHQMWIAQLFPFERPRSLLTSGGLGTMGYGLPAGIGAKFAAPDRNVVVVSGDGSIQMNIQELGTAVQYNVDIKVVILNNYFLGMVRQWQERFYQERYSYSAMSVPNFVKLADAYGAKGFRIEKSQGSVAHHERSLRHSRSRPHRRRDSQGRGRHADDSAGRLDVRNALRVARECIAFGSLRSQAVSISRCIIESPLRPFHFAAARAHLFPAVYSYVTAKNSGAWRLIAHPSCHTCLEWGAARRCDLQGLMNSPRHGNFIQKGHQHR